MLTNLLKFKDYYARIAFDPSADAFHGRVIGMQDVIDFYGASKTRRRSSYRASIMDMADVPRLNDGSRKAHISSRGSQSEIGRGGVLSGVDGMIVADQCRPIS